VSEHDLARHEEWVARRHSLAVKLERLAQTAAQTAQGLRNGAPLTLAQIRLLSVREQAVWEAIELERATRL
jgi:hypothetical protein